MNDEFARKFKHSCSGWDERVEKSKDLQHLTEEMREYLIENEKRRLVDFFDDHYEKQVKEFVSQSQPFR